MKNQPSTRNEKQDQLKVKREYHSPSLRCFGSIADLTNNGTNSCMSDGSSACEPGGINMTQKT